MQNSINIVGVVLNSCIKDDKCYFSIECSRPYKEKTGDFKKDVFDCVGYKQALDSFLKTPEIGEKIAISGSLFKDEQNNCYIDVYQIDYLN